MRGRMTKWVSVPGQEERGEDRIRKCPACRQPELGRVREQPGQEQNAPPDISAVGLWATVRTSWVWCWNGFVRTHCFSLLLEVTETSWKWNTVPSAVPTTILSSCWEIKSSGRYIWAKQGPLWRIFPEVVCLGSLGENLWPELEGRLQGSFSSGS